MFIRYQNYIINFNRWSLKLGNIFITNTYNTNRKDMVGNVQDGSASKIQFLYKIMIIMELMKQI